LPEFLSGFEEQTNNITTNIGKQNVFGAEKEISKGN
jgi:hypothetical protein